jgi:plasmid maintenance system antidote protein VapI
MTKKKQLDKTPKEIAEWMVEKICEEEYVLHEDMVIEIQQIFGKKNTYKNVNDNYAISKEILKEFRKLNEGVIVWVRSDKAWRLIEADDPIGVRQVD